MSQSTATAKGAAEKKGGSPPKDAPKDAHGGHGGGHGGHRQYPFVAHHFDSPAKQFEAGKLGIWVFLVTEVLFFSGLFCAYAVYRAMHPEIFEYAHYYLDKNLGALNTVVLLGSSFTAAWAVRNAQLKERKKLITNIVLTIACALTFMVVKYYEYSHKFHDGLLWGKNFNPTVLMEETPGFRAKHPERAAKYDREKVAYEAEMKALGDAAKDPANANKLPKKPGEAIPPHTHRFFSIYFFMTGLHGIHVIAGIIVWVWMLLKALRDEFGPLYFGPVDYAALYWHLVDLVWIYLFPLLYLIS